MGLTKIALILLLFLTNSIIGQKPTKEQIDSLTKIAYKNENNRELTSTETKYLNYMKDLLDNDFKRFVRAKVYCFKGNHGYRFLV